MLSLRHWKLDHRRMDARSAARSMSRNTKPIHTNRPITKVAGTVTDHRSANFNCAADMFNGPTARMVCVLTLLAASMVAGSAVLAWLEPRTEQAPVSAAVQRQQAQVAVTNTATPARRWRGVKLVALAEDALPRHTHLTATTDAGNAHFIVSTGGAIRALVGWYDQRTIGDDARLRVGVVDLVHPSPAQRRGLAILMDALGPYLPHDAVIDVIAAPARG